MDAVVLGIFVTLSHTSGIVLVALLANLGSEDLVPQKVEAYLAVFTGILVIVLGLWTLWTQRDLFGPAPRGEGVSGGGMSFTAVATDHGHRHDSLGEHTHSHPHGKADHTHTEGEAGWHSHGWGIKHNHALPDVGSHKMSMWMLIGLGVAGGLLPDPAALAILLSALAQGKVLLGLATVVVFSIGFAATLVVVGVVAAQVGKRVLDWLSGPWAVRIQLGTSALIVAVGVWLTWNALGTLASLV